MKKLLSTMLVVTIMLSLLGCSSSNDELETPKETNYGNEVNQTENENIEPIITPSQEDEKPDIDPQPIQSTEDFEITSDDAGNVILTAYKGNGGAVVIPDGVTEIAPHVFDLIMNPNGIAITSVYIPDSVKNIGEYAFLSCHSLDGGLASVRMSSNIEKIGESAFDNCIYLTDVTFDEIPAHNIKIGDKAFAYCEKLEHCDLYGLSCTLGKDVYIGTSLVKNKTLEKIIEDNKAAITEEIYSIIREAEKVRYDIREPELEIVSIIEDRADCIFWSDWEWSRKAEEDPMILGMYEAMEALSDAQEIEYANDIIQGWIPEIESWYISERIETRIVIKQNDGSWSLHYPHVENGEETLFDLAEYAAEHWTEDSEARKQGGADIINDAIRLYREMEKPYGKWTQFTETHTVSGQEFTVSFTCPEKWQSGNSGILNDENGKRIGERVFRENFSFEEFRQESSRSDGHSVLNNPDSPYQGTTESGMKYVGYHKSVKSSIDYSGAEVYTFLVQYNDSMFMHISVWQQDNDEYDDFLNSVVLPIINSVTIEEPENENISPANTLPQNNELGGIVECPVHFIDYHSFDDVFIQYVGEEVFYEWIQSQEEHESDDDCLFGYGFPDFIKHFGITEETYCRLFEDTFSSYMYDHPAELLFHGTEEEIETYYRDLEANKVRLEEKLCILELKQALADKAVQKIDNIRTATIEELYNASSLSEDELLAIIQNTNRTKLYVNLSPEKILEAKPENDIFVEGPNHVTTEIYENQELAFRVEFPDTWKDNYNVVANPQSSSSVIIETTWGGILCFIFRQTTESWAESGYGELVPVEYRLLGENSDYVFLLYFASDVQYDHENEEQVNTYKVMREDLYNIKFEILHEE